MKAFSLLYATKKLQDFYVRSIISVKHKTIFSGDIPDPPGQGPVQLAVGDPASAGGLG